MDLNHIRWRKASYSSGNGGACVEVGTARHAVAVRDSQDPAGPALAFAPARWQAFTRRVRGNQARPPAAG
jgi:Domain of unknown function (DUF397)